MRHHIRLTITIVVTFAVAAGSMAFAQDPKRGGGTTPRGKKANTQMIEVAVPDGPRLREIAPIDGPVPLIIGGTIGAPLLGTAAETILNREFQFITPANAMKQTSIHPEPGKPRRMLLSSRRCWNIARTGLSLGTHGKCEIATPNAAMEWARCSTKMGIRNHPTMLSSKSC